MDIYQHVRQKALIDWQKQWTKQRQMAEELANQLVEKTFIFNLPWDMEQTLQPVVMTDQVKWADCPFDDMEWVFALNRHRYYIWLGRAYQLNKEQPIGERYKQAYFDQMSDWFNQMPLNEQTQRTGWRSIEAGLRGGYWLEALSYFYDQASPQFLADMRVSLEQHADYLLTIDTPFSHLSNWGILEAQGLFKIGLALDRQDYQEAGRQRLEKRLPYQVRREGDSWEQSPMYHNEVLICLLDVLALAGNQFSTAFKERVKQMAYVNLWWKKPDHTEFIQGDSDDFDLRDILTFSAWLFTDGQLKSGGYQQADAELGWRAGYQAVLDYEAIDNQSPAQTSVFLTAGGNAYLRSDWSERANLLHFFDGSLGTGHGGSDKLHIDLVGLGEDILIDSGRYTYVEKAKRYELKAAMAHNTFVLDQQDFSKVTGSWSFDRLPTPIKGPVYSDDKFDFVQGGHLGYIDKGTFVSRKVLFIKPDIYVISDEIYGIDEHDYQAFYHFHPKGELKTSDGRVTYQGQRVQAEFYFGGQNQFDWEKKDYSPRYNRLIEHPVLTVSAPLKKKDYRTVVVTIAEKESGMKGLAIDKVEWLPVKAFSQLELKDSLAKEAIRIRRAERSYIVYLTHEETWSNINLYEVDGHYVRGRLAVIDETDGAKMTIIDD